MTRKNNEKCASNIMNEIILTGGPQIGFNTNPEASNQKQYLEINGQKIVCIAQGGECRFNHKFYSFGLKDIKSWTTPVIDENCPNNCHYKVMVCDNHKCDCDYVEYYPEYNKFAGLYKRYCRNFEKFGIS